MNYSVRNIVIAVGLAVCAVIAVLVYTSNVRQKAEQSQQRVQVLVALKDLPAGTTGEQVIKNGLLVPKDVVRADQAPGALTSTTGLEGKVITQTVYQGQQVQAAVFQPPLSTASSIRIQGNQRAISLPVDGNSGLIGTLHDGDHVDVLESVKVTKQIDGTEIGVTRPLLRNVLVLKAANTSGGSGLSSGNDSGSVLLAVSDLEANKLLWAKENADIWLVARPTAGPQDSPVTVETLESMLLDGLNPKQVKDLLKKSDLQVK